MMGLQRIAFRGLRVHPERYMREQSQRRERGFPPTQWSLIGRAREEDSKGTRPALEELLTRYLPALRVHLLIRQAGNEDAIQDLLQGFIASRILESNLIATAAPSRGKFRTLLLTSLDRYVIDQHRRASAQMRDGAREVLFVEAADVPASPAASLEFDVAWVTEVLRQSVERLSVECEGEDKVHLWKLFEARILRPAIDDVMPISYEQLVVDLGFQSPSQAWNALVTVKRMFERNLRSVIREYVDDEALVDAEIRDLRVHLCGGAE
jgi:DNA-directed RNA polymerase specialized sigma24 family protein